MHRLKTWTSPLSNCAVLPPLYAQEPGGYRGPVTVQNRGSSPILGHCPEALGVPWPCCCLAAARPGTTIVSEPP